MTTANERLIDLAETESERKPAPLWTDETRNENCARQRAWQVVAARGQFHYPLQAASRWMADPH